MYTKTKKYNSGRLIKMFEKMLNSQPTLKFYLIAGILKERGYRAYVSAQLELLRVGAYYNAK